MRRQIALAGMLAMLAAPAVAQSLQGEWQFHRQGHDGRYTGTVVIDRDNEARIKGRSTRQAYSQCGSVQVNGGIIEISFTSAKSELAYSPDHFYCTFSGPAALVCYNRDAAGHREPASFVLARIGGIPDTPAGRLEDACPLRERPNSRARRPEYFA
jgi:hypothetical protein